MIFLLFSTVALAQWIQGFLFQYRLNSFLCLFFSLFVLFFFATQTKTNQVPVPAKPKSNETKATTR